MCVRKCTAAGLYHRHGELQQQVHDKTALPFKFARWCILCVRVLVSMDGIQGSRFDPELPCPLPKNMPAGGSGMSAAPRCERMCCACACAWARGALRRPGCIPESFSLKHISRQERRPLGSSLLICVSVRLYKGRTPEGVCYTFCASYQIYW